MSRKIQSAKKNKSIHRIARKIARFRELEEAWALLLKA